MSFAALASLNQALKEAERKSHLPSSPLEPQTNNESIDWAEFKTEIKNFNNLSRLSPENRFQNLQQLINRLTKLANLHKSNLINVLIISKALPENSKLKVLSDAFNEFNKNGNFEVKLNGYSNFEKLVISIIKLGDGHDISVFHEDLAIIITRATSQGADKGVRLRAAKSDLLSLVALESIVKNNVSTNSSFRRTGFSDTIYSDNQEFKTAFNFALSTLKNFLKPGGKTYSNTIQHIESVSKKQTDYTKKVLKVTFEVIFGSNRKDGDFLYSGSIPHSYSGHFHFEDFFSEDKTNAHVILN